MDDTLLVSLLGNERHTPFGEAVDATFDGMGASGGGQGFGPPPKPGTA